MYQLVIIGAGPAGISVAAEARRSGIPAEDILIVEKGEAHSWTIRKLYPEAKLVTANYKGHAAVCHGVMCIPDQSKSETLSYLDEAIETYGLEVRYREEVHSIERLESVGLRLNSSGGLYETLVCVVAIGIFARPNKPDYTLPGSVRAQVHFDVNSTEITGSDVLVVGGGDSASEYAQYLHERGNRVALSYRGAEFRRMNPINRESLETLEARGVVEILRSSIIRSVSKSEAGVIVEFEDGERNFEHIVYALGGTTPVNFLRTVGIELDGDAPVLGDGGETSVPGLFLAGDLVAGSKGGSIVAAFNSARQTMQRICDEHLECSIDGLASEASPNQPA